MTAPSHQRRVLSSAQIRLAAALIGTSFLVAGVLGIVRSAIINALFGTASGELDAFYAAYRIPEALFTLVAGGALGASFIPVFTRFLSSDNEPGAWRLANTVLTYVTLASTVLAILSGVFAPQIVTEVLSVGKSAPVQVWTIDLMRIMLVTVVIFGVSGLLMGILNASQHFLTPALAPSMKNLGEIAGAVLLTPALGIYGLAWGAVFGALLHLAIQIPALPSIRFRPQVALRWKGTGAGEVLTLMIPRVIGQGATQINFIVNVALSSRMGDGPLTALTVAFTLMFTVLGVLGQSIGTAVFPSLSMQAAQGDLTGYRRTLANALRAVLFTNIPAGVGLIVLGVPLIATLFERGLWTANSTLATAWALGLFAIGLPAFALQEVLARSFYALKDTLTPVVIGVAGVVLNVVLSLVLIQFVRGSDPAQGALGGLALANVIATILESAAMWVLLRRRAGSLHDAEVAALSVRTLASALVMGGVLIALETVLRETSPVLRLLIGGAIGVAVFEGVALALRVPEAHSVPATILRRFGR